MIIWPLVCAACIVLDLVLFDGGYNLLEIYNPINWFD